MTVVVPTIGRPDLLRACLTSIGECRPRAAEVLVVDQGDAQDVQDVVHGFGSIGARHVRCPGRGVATARNLGLRRARHEIVLATDDDCTVAVDWVLRGWSHMQGERRGIVTGRVLPAGERAQVPSTNLSTLPRRFERQDFAVLFTGNMVGLRDEMLAIGGFDERMRLSASDNEFCYRWLKQGRPMRFEPDLVVWHHDWRSGAELERLYVRYAVGQGMLYAKLLWSGDVRVVGLHLARDLYLGSRGLAARLRHGKPDLPDWRRGLLLGLPRGLWLGFRTFGPRAPRRGST